MKMKIKSLPRYAQQVLAALRKLTEVLGELPISTVRILSGSDPNSTISGVDIRRIRSLSHLTNLPLCDTRELEERESLFHNMNQAGLSYASLGEDFRTVGSTALKYIEESSSIVGVCTPVVVTDSIQELVLCMAGGYNMVPANHTELVLYGLIYQPNIRANIIALPSLDDILTSPESARILVLRGTDEDIKNTGFRWIDLQQIYTLNQNFRILGRRPNNNMGDWVKYVARMFEG